MVIRARDDPICKERLPQAKATSSRGPRCRLPAARDGSDSVSLVVPTLMMSVPSTGFAELRRLLRWRDVKRFTNAISRAREPTDALAGVNVTLPYPYLNTTSREKLGIRSDRLASSAGIKV